MNRQLSLQDLLDARERRAQRQMQLLAAYPGCTLVSLSVNMPGPQKRCPAADRLFAAGCRALLAALWESRLVPVHGETARLATGCEARFLVAARPEAVKRLTCQIEEALPYGRLLDADVWAPEGRPLSRTGLGLPERRCMVCGRAGAYCASRRLHPLPEVLDAFFRIAAKLPEEEL